MKMKIYNIITQRLAAYVPKALRKNNYLQNELLLGRISQITQDNQITWKCNLRNTQKNPIQRSQKTYGSNALRKNPRSNVLPVLQQRK